MKNEHGIGSIRPLAVGFLAIAILSGCASSKKSFEAGTGGPAQVAKIDNGGTGAADPLSGQKGVPDGGQLLWQGISGKSSVTITSTDILVDQGGVDEPLLSSHVKRVEGQSKASEDASDSCKDTFWFTPISLVDGLLTLEQETLTACEKKLGNSPRSVLWFTIDLGKRGEIPYSFASDLNIEKPGRLAKLTDYFSDEQVVAALLDAPEIKAALGARTAQGIGTVGDLLADLKDEGFGKTSTAQLTPESLYAFSFDRIEADRVVVRLSLIPMGRRFQIEYLEIKLSIEGKLKESLRLADTGNEGFLGQKATEIFSKKLRDGIEIVSYWGSRTSKALQEVRELE